MGEILPFRKLREQQRPTGQIDPILGEQPSSMGIVIPFGMQPESSGPKDLRSRALDALNGLREKFIETGAYGKFSDHFIIGKDAQPGYNIIFYVSYGDRPGNIYKITTIETFTVHQASTDLETRIVEMKIDYCGEDRFSVDTFPENIISRFIQDQDNQDGQTLEYIDQATNRIQGLEDENRLISLIDFLQNCKVLDEAEHNKVAQWLEDRLFKAFTSYGQFR